MLRTILFGMICLLAIQFTLAQRIKDSTKISGIKWSGSVGVSWKSDDMEVFTLNRVRKKIWTGFPLTHGGGPFNVPG